MPDSIGVKPQGLKSRTDDYDRVSERLKNLAQGIRELLEHIPPDWEGDPISKEFTKIYIEGTEKMLGATSGLLRIADEFVQNLSLTADNSERVEEENLQKAQHFGGRVGRG